MPSKPPSSASTRFRHRTASPISRSKDPTAISGSARAAPRKSAASIRIPAVPRVCSAGGRTACRSALPSAATAISGSPKSKAIASDASRLTARSRNSQLPTRQSRPRRHCARTGRQCLVLRRRCRSARARHPRRPGQRIRRSMTPGSRPLSIVVRDGALWFSQAGGSRIARMTLDGEVTEFAIPRPDSQPRAMALHPDGSIWFVETGANALGRIGATARSSSSPFRHRMPRRAELRQRPMAMFGSLKILLTRSVEWTANGAMIGEYDIPTPASGARCITAMSDGRLFFTQYDIGMIGEIIFS